MVLSPGVFFRSGAFWENRRRCFSRPGFGHVLNDFFTAITKPGATLTVALYFYAKEDGEFGVAFAIASILMAMTLLLNIAAGVVTKRFGREKNNE